MYRNAKTRVALQRQAPSFMRPGLKIDLRMHQIFYSHATRIAKHPWLFIFAFLVLSVGMILFLPNAVMVDNAAFVATNVQDASFRGFAKNEAIFGLTGELTILVKPKAGGNALKKEVFLNTLDFLQEIFEKKFTVNGVSVRIGQACQSKSPELDAEGLPMPHKRVWRESAKSLAMEDCKLFSVLGLWGLNRSRISDLNDSSIAQRLWQESNSNKNTTSTLVLSTIEVFNRRGVDLLDANLLPSAKTTSIAEKNAFAESFSVQIPFLPALNSAGEANIQNQALLNVEVSNYLTMLDIPGIDVRWSNRLNRVPVTPQQILTTLGLLVLYCIIINFKANVIRAQLALVLTGILSVALALATTVGLLTMLGVELTVLAIPGFFLVIAIGVDDMFIIHNSVMRRVGSARKRFAVGLADASTTITLTSLTDCSVFFCATLSTSSMVKSFGLTIGTALLIDYIFQVNFFGAAMFLDLKRQQKYRMDLLCCIQCHQPSRTTGWKYDYDISETTDSASGTRTSMEEKSDDLFVFVEDVNMDSSSVVTTTTNGTNTTENTKGSERAELQLPSSPSKKNRRVSRSSRVSDSSSTIINEDDLRRMTLSKSNSNATGKSALGSMVQSTPTSSRESESNLPTIALTQVKSNMAAVESLDSGAVSTSRQLKASVVFGPSDEANEAEFLKRRSSTMLRTGLTNFWFKFASSKVGQWTIIGITVVVTVVSLYGLSILQVGTTENASWLKPSDPRYKFQQWRRESWPMRIIADIIVDGKAARDLHTELVQDKIDQAVVEFEKMPQVVAVPSIVAAVRGFVQTDSAWGVALNGSTVQLSKSGVPLNDAFALALRTMIVTPGWEWIADCVVFKSKQEIETVKWPLVINGDTTATANAQVAKTIQNRLMQLFGTDVNVASQFLWLTQVSFELFDQLLFAVGVAIMFSALFTSFLLINPMGGLFVVFSIIFTFVVCLGVMGLMGYPLVLEAGLALIITSGLSIDVVAHMCHEYFVVPGTSRGRMEQMFGEIGPPVVHGFVTTSLVALMIPSSAGALYTILFIYTVSVLVGFWFGFFLAPVLLIYTNPPPALRDLEMQLELAANEKEVDRRWRHAFKKEQDKQDKLSGGRNGKIEVIQHK
eukprot:TRINITY_DN6840_c0_g1_i1.p1 TRINITY_DN6840_c0_g1~~TRINITY_DN6840_c0_g1_i1.p1  ORF type:complete len:1162 (+),score=314.63 TRINITY_DN6840_c0_g1_i1:137-3487(+)